MRAWSSILLSICLIFSASAVRAQAFDVEKDFLNQIDYTYNNRFPDEGLLNSVYGGKIIARDVLPNGQHTMIMPIINEHGLNFNFYYDKAAVNEPRLLLADLITWVSIVRGNTIYNSSGMIKGGAYTNVDNVNRPHQMAELLNNVAAGSPTAKARYLEMKVALTRSIRIAPEILHKMNLGDHELEIISAELEAEYEKQQKFAAKFIRENQKRIDDWRKDTQMLERIEALPQKLNDFVLNNDRKAVRNLLEAYLPWAVMEPTEVLAWKNWLEAIEHPNWNDTIVAARGLDYDEDKVQRLKTADGEKVAFFSTVLNKNQGSFSRRLRSLSTNRVKNGDESMDAKSKSISIAGQFQSHASNPTASNFLSFSFDLDTVAEFTAHDKVDPKTRERKPHGAILVVNMDRRRMVPNIMSPLEHEMELLVPLIIFPDEVVVFREGRATSSAVAEVAAETRKKTGLSILNDKEAAQEYFDKGFKFFNEVAPKNGLCTHVFK